MNKILLVTLFALCVFFAFAQQEQQQPEDEMIEDDDVEDESQNSEKVVENQNQSKKPNNQKSQKKEEMKKMKSKTDKQQDDQNQYPTPEERRYWKHVRCIFNCAAQADLRPFMEAAPICGTDLSCYQKPFDEALKVIEPCYRQCISVKDEQP